VLPQWSLCGVSVKGGGGRYIREGEKEREGWLQEKLCRSLVSSASSKPTIIQQQAGGRA
jgi:hypothetical protein